MLNRMRGADDVAPLPHDWSAERFVADHLAYYVERCAAWRRRYEDISE